MRLTFVVENTKELSGGTPAACQFDAEGGAIGSSEDSKWQLRDRKGSVDSKHLDVFQADGYFCGEVVGESGIVINGAQRTAPTGTIFQICDGDTYKVGAFKISAIVELENVENINSSESKLAGRFTSLETIVPDRSSKGAEDISAEAILDAEGNGDEYIHLNRNKNDKKQDLDPMVMLEDATGSLVGIEDPVTLLDQEMKKQEPIIDEKGRVSDTMSTRYASETNARGMNDPAPGNMHIDLPRIKAQGSQQMNNTRTEPYSEIDEYIDSMEIDLVEPGNASSPRSYSELAEFESWTGGITAEELPQDSTEAIDHVVLRPLLAALGISVKEMTVPEANRLSREIGEAVTSTIKGIMEVHRSQQTDRSYMKESQLHLVEDNPLRLESNHVDAIRNLFFTNSPVHLNASSAIAESFELIANHEKASGIATEKALEAVLMALAPKSLAKRFSKYRGHAPRTGNLDAWHWQMYQHYYNELKTDRQRGLGRMFREVYEQVYSQAMRQQTLGGEL